MFAQVPGAGERHELGSGDGLVEVVGDGERCADVVIAVDQQRRDGDAGQDVAKILRGRGGHGPEADRMRRQHAGSERVDRRLRSAVGEHRRQECTDELAGCQIGQDEGLAEALFGDVGRQRAGPSGVGRRQGQGRRGCGMPTGQLKGQRTAERQPGHMRPFRPSRAMNPARQSA